MRQAPALQSAKLDIAVAEAQIGETWARHDWHVAAQATGDEDRRASSAGSRSAHEDIYGVTASTLSRALPTGGTIDLHVGTQYSKSRSTCSASPIDSTHVAGHGVRVDHPAAAQGPRSARCTTRPSSKARAPARRQPCSRADSPRSTRSQTIVSAYWDLVLAERQVAITEASLDLARERLRVTEIGAKGGKIAQSRDPRGAADHRDPRGGRAQRRARGRSTRRSRCAARPGCRSAPARSGCASPTELDDPRITAGRSATLIERSYAASPELAQLAKQDASATIDIEVTENGLLPQLDAALSIGPIGIDAELRRAARSSSLVEFKSIAINGSLTFSRSL